MMTCTEKFVFSDFTFWKGEGVEVSYPTLFCAIIHSFLITAKFNNSSNLV